MKQTLRLLALSAALLAAAIASAFAHEYDLGQIHIDHPWARPSAVANGATYLVLKNNGAEEDTLVSAQTPAAESAEIHEHINDNGVMRMRRVEGGVKVAPGASVAFKPGAYHIMLLGLKQKLEEGKSIPLTLTFAKGGKIDVDVKIEKGSAADSDGHEHHH